MSLPARLAIRGTIDHMRWILRLLANAAALAIATWILSGITLTGSSTASQILTLLIVALIFGVLNAIIKPIFAIVTDTTHTVNSWPVLDRDQCLHAPAHFMVGRLV